MQDDVFEDLKLNIGMDPRIQTWKCGLSDLEVWTLASLCSPHPEAQVDCFLES